MSSTKKCMFLAMAVGSCLTAGAFAQVKAKPSILVSNEKPVEVVPSLPMFPGTIEATDITPGRGGAGHDVGGGHYGSRDVLQSVYKTNDTTPGSLGAGGCYILEDVNFCPGGWCTYGSQRSISTIIWHFQAVNWVGTPIFAQTGTPTAEFDTVFEFYDAPQGGFTANPMVTQPPSQTVVVDTVVGTGFGWTVTVNLGTPVPIAGPSCFVGIRYIQHGTFGTGFQGKGVRLWDGTNAGSADQGANPVGQPATTQLVNPRFDGVLPNQIGASLIDYGRDYDTNGLFEGEVGDLGAPHNHRSLATVQSLELKGIGPTQQPVVNTTICGPDLADGLTVRADNVPTGQVHWFRVCLPSAANDAARTFLDIDTETSAVPMAVGVYDSQGNIMDADNGVYGTTGQASQVSFGVGRRAAFAPGLSQQYDGRSGQLAASTGTGNGYFVAVAPMGASFGPQFNVNPGTGTGGACNLRLQTNVNGAPLAASVAPLINGTDYGSIDPTAPGGNQLPGVSVLVGHNNYNGFGGVVWSTFTLTAPATAASHGYLDLDMARLSPNVNEIAYIFNSNGDQVYQDIGSGPAPGASQFSLGAAHDVTYDANDPGNTTHFQGNTPAGNTGLPPGTYYLAMAFQGTQDLGTGTGGRFHVRGTNGSNLGVGADLYTGVAGPAGGCTADFNCDGDIGTDLDISSFFACLSGTCPPAPCANTADFNNDGDIGTDTDIESFFRVLGGGPC